MLFFGLILAWAIAGYFSASDDKMAGKAEKFIHMACGAVLGVSIGAMVCVVWERCLPTEFSGQRTEIVAARTKLGIQGSFFVGTGSIQSEPYYFLYYNQGDGGIRMWTIAAHRLMIYEGERGDGYVIDERIIYPSWWRTMICPFTFISSPRNFVAFVPHGTVKRDISFDLKDL